eukprot:Filipodium_phascolosomae@DN797_c0_g1_i1.p1
MLRASLIRFSGGSSGKPFWASKATLLHPPPDIGVVFKDFRHDFLPYYLCHAKYWTLYFVIGSGLMLGNKFYLRVFQTKNPPNPERHRWDTAPNRHPHEVEEDDDDD